VSGRGRTRETETEGGGVEVIDDSGEVDDDCNTPATPSLAIVTPGSP
jgi:hypothetical protein